MSTQRSAVAVEGLASTFHDLSNRDDTSREYPRLGHAMAGESPGTAAPLVDERIAGQPEDALPDLVALDLRGSAGDRQATVHEDQERGHRPGAVRVGRVRTAERGEDRRHLVAD